MTAPVRFDDALAAACQFVRDHFPALGPRQVLLRDVYGYIAVLIDRPVDGELLAWRSALHASLGGYSPGEEAVLVGHGDMATLEEVLSDPDALPADDQEPVVQLVERQIIGRDWSQGSAVTSASPPRVVFFGIKGGVGRSTALAMVAWHLAQKKKRVLVVDLDLESPGVSTLLVPHEDLPRFGVVDWLVESAVGQGDRSLVDDMFASSPLSMDSPGQIFVVPAGGRQPGSYAAKLARAYLSATSPGGDLLSFTERLDELLRSLTSFREVDVVLLDSRAGLHEIGAAAVTRLGAQSLLFATGNAQTFWAYETLFHELRRSPQRARALRENLKLVSAMIPSSGREEYLGALLERAYDLFRDNLYDELSAGEVAGFSFDLDDDSAPHYPLTVFWSPEFAGDFSPVQMRLPDLRRQIDAAFGSLFRGVEDLLDDG